MRPKRAASRAGTDADPSKAAAPFAISYADLKDYTSQNAVFDSLAGYTSPRPVTHQEAGADGSCLGLPVSDEEAAGDGRVCDFERGRIDWRPGEQRGRITCR